MEYRVRRAFTLVELLVVVAIIALLSAIILPGLSRAREYAYFSRCKSNLKQIGIGFLLYAGNNRGCMPEIETRCPGPGRGGAHDNWTGKRIGVASLKKWLYYSPKDVQLVKKIYSNIKPGKKWDGTPSSVWPGYPREAGKYLPIEILWDPILKIRNWAYGSNNNYYAGTEKSRDEMSRLKGFYGYRFFVNSIGCYYYQSVNRKDPYHVLPAWNGTGPRADADEPFRPATKSRTMRSTNLPSAWLGVGHTPIVGVPQSCYDGAMKYRRNVGHFGATHTIAGIFKFNVLHIDGHVGDTIWAMPDLAGDWLFGGYWSYPYGWKHCDNRDYGIEKLPDFDERWDDNT
jgi:prepilin-type N-terminal cleavage/methylation domain-containing protein